MHSKNLLPVAFKEWACVCEALFSGEQIFVFRKGGIHEPAKQFLPEHTEFYLFPTFEHQNENDLNEKGRELLLGAQLNAPEKDTVRLSAYAHVVNSFWISDYELLKPLEKMHVWSEAAIRARYQWGKQEGIHLLVLRVYKLIEPKVIPLLPRYGGCRSWVDLELARETKMTEAVLADPEFKEKSRIITQLIGA